MGLRLLPTERPRTKSGERASARRSRASGVSPARLLLASRPRRPGQSACQTPVQSGRTRRLRRVMPLPTATPAIAATYAALNQPRPGRLTPAAADDAHAHRATITGARAQPSTPQAQTSRGPERSHHLAPSATLVGPERKPHRARSATLGARSATSWRRKLSNCPARREPALDGCAGVGACCAPWESTIAATR
jgi:hypothetical protein